MTVVAPGPAMATNLHVSEGPKAQTMPAAVVTAPGRIEVREVPLPEPGDGQVRVRLEGCGVCASNLPPWKGREWFTYPMSPGQLGHEGWGVVDAVGRDVRRFSPGDRVAFLSERAYAGYDVADESKAMRLPDALAGQPFPAEPLGCAVNVFRRSDIRAGQTVAVVGVGFLGAIVTRLAANAGARVIAVSRRPFSLDVAKSMGAAERIPMLDHWKIIGQVKDLTAGQFCDVVIEAVGKQWPLDLSAELTRERGRLVVAGYHQDGPRQVNMQLWNWRGLDVINAHERDPAVYLEGMRMAAESVVSGTLDPAPLYTHRYALGQLGAALDATRDRPDGFLKALIVM
jgi:threonine dehydrogenase-like Zn-dependent dehydrogenase